MHEPPPMKGNPYIPPGTTHRCKVKCDVCGVEQTFASSPQSVTNIDDLIHMAGWRRFGPSGQDLCHKCVGGSPNTVIPVSWPLI